MTTLVLHDVHAARNARFLDLHGAEAVADYGDPLAEHRAFRAAAGVIDLSFRGRLVLLGADRRKLLNGQVTQNIKDLAEGQGCYAALVNAKAKMLADMNVFALASELLLDVEPGLAGPVAERLEKYVIADDVQIVDASPLYGHLSVQGPRSRAVVEELGLFPTLPEQPLQIVPASHPDLGELYLAHHPRLGTRGFDVFAPATSMATVAERLLAAAESRGGRAAGWTAFDTARIEAGIPRYGVDMAETHLPPECGITERAISYTKGCYSGQEVIARIRTYGQVSKALRGLHLQPGNGPEPAPLPERGTRLYKDGREVGSLTSVVHSSTLNRGIALGYVRRECNGPGTELTVGAPDGPTRAVIVPLPFVGPEFADG